MRNSPLFFMRWRLSRKEGKKVGERNREYRETAEDGISLRMGRASEWHRGWEPD